MIVVIRIYVKKGNVRRLANGYERDRHFLHGVSNRDDMFGRYSVLETG